MSAYLFSDDIEKQLNASVYYRSILSVGMFLICCDIHNFSKRQKSSH